MSGSNDRGRYAARFPGGQRSPANANPGRAIGAVFLAWLIFIGIDFLFHASILRLLWDDPVPAFLEPQTLFERIPFGYGSFLVLVILVFHLLTRIHGRLPEPGAALTFGLFFGGLFSLNHFLALYSFVAIPAKHLGIFSLVYFLELTVVSWLLAALLSGITVGRILGTVGALILLLAGGVAIQNL